MCKKNLFFVGPSYAELFALEADKTIAGILEQNKSLFTRLLQM